MVVGRTRESWESDLRTVFRLTGIIIIIKRSIRDRTTDRHLPTGPKSMASGQVN